MCVYLLLVGSRFAFADAAHASASSGAVDGGVLAAAARFVAVAQRGGAVALAVAAEVRRVTLADAALVSAEARTFLSSFFVALQSITEMRHTFCRAATHVLSQKSEDGNLSATKNVTKRDLFLNKNQS